ncbi:4'-phosphopantetheinyl transferase superfamily protein [Granulicella mallensis]|uniref:4'-phosphopantetheinyl transferase n=1 Tax=Granulicella mallensis TaxID=940614 RepID=A0A7W7ZNV5_9BACT|nr:4'-phosphopantetheinyl transferase superfamily protein [Granulicella mallensis]MBB5062621.1 4'-phosphopantetheinyl transferase [Granulicella mallensis]
MYRLVLNLPQEFRQFVLFDLPSHEAMVDGIRIVWFQRDVPEPVCKPLAHLLSRQERERADSMVFAADRHSFIWVHACKRALLAEYVGMKPSQLEFMHNAQGKPFLVGSDLQFSLSHAGSYAVIALVRGRRLGVDIEPIRRLEDAMGLARRFFSEKEAERLRDLEGTPDFGLAFFECWTRKEAFIKALGGGLSIPLNGFEVSFHPSPNPDLRGISVATDGWILHDLKLVDGHAAALVAEVFS